MMSIVLDRNNESQGQKRKREDQEDGRKKSRHSSEKDEDKTSSEPSTNDAGPTNKISRLDPDKKNARTVVKGQHNPRERNGHPSKKPHNPLAARRNALQQVRQKLPIWPRASDIRKKLLERDVLVLTAETGSGKSTQVPQFLLSSEWCTGRIAVTQPRRVAAISLARRVADEMGTPLGKSSPAAQVGYSVRFDDNVGRSNKIKFLTEGMLLQEMLRDPALTEYSCVLVDEVHERSVNVDLILGFLRGLVTGTSEASKKRKGKPLKVVIMSATADTESLVQFFHQGYQQSRIEAIALATSNDNSTNGATDKAPQNSDTSDEQMLIKIKGRQHAVQTVYLSEPTQDILEAALLRIFEIHRKEPMPGDILVFLTGQDAVMNLQRSVEETAPAVITLDSGLPKLQVLPLFAALPQAQQQLIFAPAPPNTRKVILATNIAETSITVPGVRFVIDSGKAKIKRYRPTIGLDSLLVKAITKSSAEQRKGRAGREAAGKCYRLYTSKDFEQFEKDTEPEILRTDLSSAMLTMKARGIEDPWNFPLLAQPSREAMGRALLQLLGINALDPDGQLNDIGRKIARLPLTPALGRVIIAAATPEMDCLLHVIDIVACFSVENIFLETKDEDSKPEIAEARARLSRRQGDHLTVLAAVQAYSADRTDRKAWARQHMVSHRAMQSVMDVRKQIRTQCQQAKLLSAETIAAADDKEIVSESTANNILKCFLQGFKTNVARLVPDGSYRTIHGNQLVAIHPSSGLFGKKVEAILYNEFVFTNKSYARGVSAIQLNWLDEVFASE
ncbi:putative ATP-dependent RNA helicase [Delphinella strobiligena]|nr:putative ATP-dependent RNA helicase [Delphinella strobiligena]